MSTYRERDLEQAFGGRFRCFQLLGRGGEGAVLAAYDRVQKHDVALKLMRDTGEPGQAERFEREYQILATTRSPLLVSVYRHGRVALPLGEGPPCQHYWYSMERCAGSVRTALPSLTLSERISTALQMLDGLSLLHAKNIAHRDIKPDNLFLTSAPAPAAVSKAPAPTLRLKIGDFGIATVTRIAPNASSGAIRGSPDYLAPERWRSDQDADWRPADQYAAGVTLFELLSLGGLPLDFAAGHCVAHERGPIRALEIPERRPRKAPKVDEVIARMLAKQPLSRFRDLAECKLALRAALSMEGLSD